MEIGLLFWFLMIVTLLWGGFGVFRQDASGRWLGGYPLLMWVCVALVGWKVFGPLLK